MALKDKQGRVIGLDLRSTWVTDADLPAIGEIPKLQSLDLSMTRITDTTRRTASSSRRSCNVACTSRSVAVWVMNTSRASSPSPSCSIALIDTSWAPKVDATAASLDAARAFAKAA